MTTEENIIRLLKAQKLTLSCAESCTGGLLSHRLTQVPGSSDVFKGAIVAYHNEIKEMALKVPHNILKNHGAVSSKVAIHMAKGIQKRFKSDYGIGITGIAGPSGGNKRKPVGLCFIAVSRGIETLCLECSFKGKRSNIKRQASSQALKLLKEFLNG